jgi:hypothetical protein
MAMVGEEVEAVQVGIGAEVKWKGMKLDEGGIFSPEKTSLKFGGVRCLFGNDSWA